MLTAAEARAKAQNDSVIFKEIRDIEDAIISAASAGDYDTTIKGTVMTVEVGIPSAVQTARVYFNVWQGSVDDRAKFIQMGKVITYFTDLGYSIERRTNPNTGDTFIWVVSW